MGTKLRVAWWIVAAQCLLCACGGATSQAGKADESTAEESAITKEDMAPRAVLHKAQLTDEVDHKRYRVKGEARTSFPPEQRVIYLVAKLKRVPTQAKIEVRWFRDAVSEPILISRVHGSETFSFIADLKPERRKLIPGPYTARVFVDDREVGGAPFTIEGNDPSLNPPKVTKLAVSKGATRRMKPKGAAKQFKSGTRKLHATFRIDGASPDAIVYVVWKRNEEHFSEQELTVAPEGRFGAHVESPSGLPDGAYTLEIQSAGETLASKSFAVGEAGGPGIDKVALGLSLNENNMPTSERTSFKEGHPAIHCGLRFLDLPPESVIELRWNLLLGEDESTYHTTKTGVPQGGSGTMGAVWEPSSGFEPGSYKLVVLLNGTPVEEVEFTIE